MRRRPNAWNRRAMQRARHRRGARGIGIPLLVLAGAALAGLAVGVAPALDAPSAPVAYAEPLGPCVATDGDTLRCGSERIRLLGVDAPELPGHCRRGRVCAPGDPHASKVGLGDALAGPLTIERVGRDRYGRTLALVAGAGGDLSCRQLARGYAIYRADWDDGSRVARTCPAAVRR